MHLPVVVLAPALFLFPIVSFVCGKSFKVCGSGSQDVKEDVLGIPSPKIFKGKEAVPHSKPYVVHLSLRNKNGLLSTCAGSILDERNILTAAHCLVEVVEVEVAAGKHNLKKKEPSEQVIRSTTFVLHERYTYPEVYNYDIAIIHLPYPLKWTGFVTPIDLPLTEPLVGSKCEALGWGRVNNRTVSDVLKTVTNDVLPLHMHLCHTEPVWKCDPSQSICIGDQNGNICKGDSGGPLVNEWSELVGELIIMDDNGCEGGGPQCFASTIVFKDWILAHMI